MQPRILIVSDYLGRGVILSLSSCLSIRYIVLSALMLLAISVRAELEIIDGYVRGLPPGQPVTAAFMRIKNPDAAAVEIVAASTDVAERAEFHAHRHRNGMMSMEKVDSISIPAGQEFVLAPGQHHLMLINLQGALKEGDRVAIELTTAQGKLIRLSLPVQSVLNEHKQH